MNNNYTAVNAFIFAGSFSIGVMKAGFNLKKVLEMTDTMLENNAFFFHKNYPQIPVILPKEWENDEYLQNLEKENIDLMCCNCPCSSLSRVNRYAKIDGERNIHFYRLFNIFEKVQPKVFVVENAPTLIKLGKPILNDMVNKLKYLYRFTIIRDEAGNHNTPMKRMRTMVIGWRKDIFNKIPIINEDKQEKITIKDILKDIYNDTTDDCKSPAFNCLRSLYKYSIPGLGLMGSLATRVVNNEEPAKTEILNVVSKTKEIKYLNNVIYKIQNDLGYWDKTPKRTDENKQFPSISGPQEYLHPIQNRCLNLLELQRMMGYPDDFDFHDSNNECKTTAKVAIGQGVPVNFGKWIAEQVKLALENKLSYDETGSDIIFQHHIKHQYSTFTYDQFLLLAEVDVQKEHKKLI